MKKFLVILICIVSLFAFVGCDYVAPEQQQSNKDVQKTFAVVNQLTANQPTPTDIEYSLERYNLMRRAYWVNGQREKAINLPCPIANLPLGYIALYSGNVIIGTHVVSGKVSSLNSYLQPLSEYYEGTATRVRDIRIDGSTSGTYTSFVNRWLPDVDGSYGENAPGVFFFTPDGKYIEHVGGYTYSDIPFEIKDPVLQFKDVTKEGE